MHAHIGDARPPHIEHIDGAPVGYNGGKVALAIAAQDAGFVLYDGKVEAIIKYQLPVTSAEMALSGIKPVMALLVMPTRVASVPEIITLAVKPAWALHRR